MSSQKRGTAACAVSWETDRAIARPLCLGCDDEMLGEKIAKAHAVGIDAPFGWPVEFAAAVCEWNFTYWTNELRKQLCFRETDRVVYETVGRWPLSVSADRIALPVMRTFALLVLEHS
jgi:hypothetical protein